MTTIEPQHLREIINKRLGMPVEQTLIKVNVIAPRVTKIRLTTPGKFLAQDDSLASILFTLATAKSISFVPLEIFITESGHNYGVGFSKEDQQIWISDWEPE